MALLVALWLLLLVSGNLFPSGRFVPGWTRWLVVALLVGLVSLAVLPSADVFDLLGGIFWFSLLLSVGVAQVYRYRHVSTPMEQQQTKWAVFGITLAIIVAVLAFLPEALFPALSQPGSLYSIVGNVISGVCFNLLIVLCFSFAVLRSRLWDIDFLIKKALVYSTLTVLLAGLYAGLVIGLERLAGAINNGSLAQQPPAIVISTLAIAALFQPLRSRIQSLIDRRFYQRRYDAAHTLATFSATLRDEVDLTQLQTRLFSVIQETMQPSQVSLWLRQPEPRRP